MQLDIFSVMMRNEFIKGTQVVPPFPFPWEKFTKEYESTARMEDYAWLTASPGFQRYEGHRRFSTIDNTQYIVPNLEFDAAMRVSLRSVRDDKVGGYNIRFQDLGMKAKEFPGYWIMQQMNLGQSTICFDGSNFFSATHNQGGGTPGSSLPAPFNTGTSGLNLLNYTSANTADGLTYKAVFLLHYGMIKPMGYQLRHGPELMTNSGSVESSENKEVRYWCDMELAAFYGFWQDAVMVNITNTPNLTDCQVIVDQVIKQFRSFTQPTASPTDPALYTHQMVKFSPEVATCVCSTGLETLLTHLFMEERIGVSVGGSTAGFTNNIYKGRMDLWASGYLNSPQGT